MKNDRTVQTTARGLQAEMVQDLNALFREDFLKTPDYLKDAEVEAMRPPGEPEDWSAKDKAFWTAMQRDYNRHRMRAPMAYAQDLPLHEATSPAPPEADGNDEDAEPPLPPDDSDGEDLLPYIIVKLDSGGVDAPEAPHRINIILLVGVFDDDPKNDGHTAVLEIIERIQSHYRERPVLGAFTFSDPIRWYLQDEPSYPFYYGAIDMTFQAPAPQNAQVEDLV